MFFLRIFFTWNHWKFPIFFFLFQNGKFAVVGTYDGRCIFYSTDMLKYYTMIHVRSARGKNAQGRKVTGIEPMPGEDKVFNLCFFLLIIFSVKAHTIVSALSKSLFSRKKYSYHFSFVYSSWSHPTTAEYDCMIFVIWLYLVNTKDMPIAAVKLELHLGEYVL